MPSCDAQTLVDLCGSQGYAKLSHRSLLEGIAASAAGTPAPVTPPIPPVTAFSYSPATALLRWIESGVVHIGDLATFNATANIANVSSISWQTGTSLTSISGISSLTGLINFTAPTSSSPNLYVLDFTGCSSVQLIACDTGSITTLILTGCSSLQNVNCSVNSIASLDLTGLVSLTFIDCSVNSITPTITGLTTCTALVTLNCSTNGITSLDCTGLVNLVTLDCSWNQIVTLNLTGITTSLASCVMTPNPPLASVVAPDLVSGIAQWNQDGLSGFDNLSGVPSVSFPSLTSTTGTFTVADNLLTTSVSFPVLATAGSLLFDDIGVLALALPSLTSCGALLFGNCPNLSSISFPALQASDDIDGNANTYLSLFTAASFPVLATVNGSIIFDNKTNLVSFSAPNLTSASALSFSGCSALTTFTQALTGNVGTVSFVNCTSLASITLGVTFCDQEMRFQGCTSLVSASFPSLVLGDTGQTISFLGCALNQASVDGFLSLANASGVATITLDLSGGTNSSPTGGILNADYVALVAAGNTVTIN